MTAEPYKSARAYRIVDNGSTHAAKTSIKRMQNRWPTARLIHLPVHASWLNQIELYFSIVQRKALTPNDSPRSRAAERLLGLGNTTAKSPASSSGITRQDQQLMRMSTSECW